MEDSKHSKILIVDDIPANIKILAEVLKEDYQILAATHGQDALEALATEPVDLILLDVLMPGMNGYQVCRALKADPNTREIPVIFVTAKSDETDETLALSLGAVDFLTKPVAASIVRARVQTHLGLKAAREALKRQNQELIKAASLREEVDRIMRHDLKSPLNAIIGFSSLLATMLPMDNEQKKMCQLVQESGYKLLNMINLSLDMFKMEQGTYHFEPKPVEMVGLVEKVRATEAEHFRARKLSCQVLLDGQPVTPQSRFFIMGEELLCYSLLNNLLNNAIDASPIKQQVTIFLDHTPVHRIRIHNPGSIPTAIRGRFFEKYVTFGKVHGTGLGTYSAKLMTETQGGTISFETSETSGTTIFLHLPPGEQEQPIPPDGSSKWHAPPREAPMPGL
ncbi:MAG: hybrid sensor histidine kinase/response regulator [Magnetococcales bacterium]|nr:hybrid sensor histidine kinase/response regulator [Magnetococcales bacterium]